MAFLLKTDGTIQEVKPAQGESFALAELQAMVGGYIEIIRTHTGDFMVCNEEGKLQRLPYNEQATERYRFGAHDRIAGDVVIAKFRELEGDEDE